MDNRFELFTSYITQINRYIQKIKSAEMSDIGLKGTHLMCMYYLGKSENGLIAAELCSLCNEDKAAISRTISQLTDMKLVYTDSKSDYRAKLLLTEKGLNIFKQISEKVNRAVNAASADLSDEKREEFYTTLKKISDNLKALLDE